MEKIHTEKAPAAVGPYSQAVKVSGMVYTSGQIALDPATGALVGSTIEEQAEQVMKNLVSVLEAAGTGPEKAVKTLCFLTDMNDFAASTRCTPGTSPASRPGAAWRSAPCPRAPSARWRSSRKCRQCFAAYGPPARIKITCSRSS